MATIVAPGGSAGEQSNQTIPASGTARANPFAFTVMVAIDAGSAATVGVAINGVSIGTSVAGGHFDVVLKPGWTITLTYTTAPTWEWFGI